jgi:hypothetical protein
MLMLMQFVNLAAAAAIAARNCLNGHQNSSAIRVCSVQLLCSTSLLGPHGGT